jgi:queuine/archaeosine tRNA-ribosyltransferase
MERIREALDEDRFEEFVNEFYAAQGLDTPPVE